MNWRANEGKEDIRFMYLELIEFGNLANLYFDPIPCICLDILQHTWVGGRNKGSQDEFHCNNIYGF